MSGIIDTIKGFVYTFSYWIFIWFLFFEFGWTKYNPFYFLCIALGLNSIQLGMMIYFENDPFGILLFIIINLFIKILPIYLLWGTPLQWKDIQAGLILFGIYLFILAWNNKLFGKNNVLYHFYYSTKNNRVKFPLTKLIRKLFNI
jgi:hypothetical protein